MRILISGGAGFLGSHLADRLLKRPEVTALVIVDNLWTGLRENLAHIDDPRLAPLVVQDIETYRDPEGLDEIYHFASPATPEWYMKEPIRTISANVGGALNLLPQLKKGGVFCYTSTSEVYGEPLVSPQPESYLGFVDCTGPRSSYDESKRCVKSILFEARRTQGARVKVGRFFNVFGPRTRMDDGRAVSNFISQAIRGLPLTVYGDGAQTRSWGYIDDIMDAAERFFWKDGSDFAGPMNIGNNREISVLEIANYIQAKFPGVAVDHLPPSPQDPANRCPDLAVAAREMGGWTCRVPYEEGIDRTIAWFQSELAKVPA